MSVSLKTLSKPKATPKKWGRSNNRDVYGSQRWRKTSLRNLREHPLCAVCGDPGDLTDHINPINNGGDVWDSKNHQTLCRRCHDKKTKNEK